MQNTAAYAMTVVLFLLRNAVTAYMLAWVRPFGLSPLTTLARDALAHAALPHGALLRTVLADVVAFTRSERFKAVRSTVRTPCARQHRSHCGSHADGVTPAPVRLTPCT